MIDLDASNLERHRRRRVRSRQSTDRHAYFRGVAEARFVLRKVFRLVEEEARKAGVDPLAHQALIQIYGSPAAELRISDVASRLDIAPAFCSALVKMLVQAGYVQRRRDQGDGRVIWLSITDLGRALLHRIDDGVQIHVDYFTQGLSAADREAALSIMLFYIGASLRNSRKNK